MTGKIDKRLAGFLAGIAICIIIWNIPLYGLPPDGRKCLALSLAAVIWWATSAMHPGFTSLALLASYTLLLDHKIVPSSLVFNLWTTPTMYLVVGGFLIAEAVRASGLGERLALSFIKKWVNSYRSVIIACYFLGFALSFLIPHPWPRSFLLISVMGYVIKAANLPKQYAVGVGLAIFAGSIPTAMILLTGDSTLNPAVAGFAETPISWMQWLFFMGIPGIAASILTCLTHIKLFPAPPVFEIDKKQIEEKIAGLGKLTQKEKIVLIVMTIAVLLWMSDSVHGLHPGWVALGTAIVFSTPFANVLGPKSWSCVNIGTLFFLCAALAIGSVGGATGMNEWVAALLMPKNAPANPYIFALTACFIAMVLHMALGSTLAVLGIASPAIIRFGVAAGMSPLVPALITYTAVVLHWALPFHHMNLLVGVGDEGGGYSAKETLKMAVPQTAIVFTTCLIEILWWQIIGLI